jgi:Mn-dependent DtxR family transcriptional regulator
VSRAVSIQKSGGFIEIDNERYITLTEIGLETAERIYETPSCDFGMACQHRS